MEINPTRNTTQKNSAKRVNTGIISNGVKSKIIIGLGNPGKEYENTYHNVGVLLIDYLINQLTTNDQRLTICKNFEYGKYNGLIFVKPLTFMNESGKAVLEVIKYFKAKPEEILIIHDDSDIESGKYKISFGRSSAGHNGVKSIIKSLKTKDFWRLRIGIRKKVANSKHKIERKKAIEMVLKKINKKDLEILEKVFEETIKLAIEPILKRSV